MIITRNIAKKVLTVIDVGLCSGLGKPVPGEMCVMAAINYALNLPHGDNPETCVGAAVREYDIKINDGPWSSNAARAKGMRKEAIAKLGSNQIDQVEFARKVSLAVIRQILPITLRGLITLIPTHSTALEAASVLCESAVTLGAARSAAWSAARSAASAASAAESAASAARSAASAARSAASAAESAAESAASAAWSAASAARSAAESVEKDRILRIASDIGLTALKELNSPGCKFLSLCKDDE